jgi:hypothetical protein
MANVSLFYGESVTDFVGSKQSLYNVALYCVAVLTFS